MSFDLLELMDRKMDGHLDTSTVAIFSSQRAGLDEMQFAVRNPPVITVNASVSFPIEVTGSEIQFPSRPMSVDASGSSSQPRESLG